MQTYTHSTNLYDKMLTNCSSSIMTRQYLVTSNLIFPTFLAVFKNNILTRKPNECYPLGISPKIQKILRICVHTLQVDASADRTSPLVTSIILVHRISVSLDHRHLISKCQWTDSLRPTKIPRQGRLLLCCT